MPLLSALERPLFRPTAAEPAMFPVEPALDFKIFSSLRTHALRQKNNAPVRRADFLKQVALNLPEVAALIEESDFGIVHLEVGAMKLATRHAITRRDFATVGRHLLLVSELLARADAELHDALRISYLEALFLDEHSAFHSEARHLLPGILANMLKQAELALETRRATTAG